ncbi:MAG: hypothetical protein L6V95_02260 [Candidatus Melainabacteria bacterium]|nr:MAG: hypothetical protein L6V95_02260 [Candidatus Melainabacteria bacterium]
MNFWQFTLASVVGRGMRFFIVSLVLMFFGEAVKQYIELIIFAVTVVIILFFVVLYKKRHKITITSKNNDVASEVVEKQ